MCVYDELKYLHACIDWRKICRLLRDLELQPILYHKNSGNTSAAQRREGSEAAAILNYLYQSSNRLKHTDYATFDAEFFLFLAHRLFQLYKARADEGTFSALELVEEPFNGGNGNKNEILKRLRAMNSVESAEMSQKFNELSLEVCLCCVCFIDLTFTYIYVQNRLNIFYHWMASTLVNGRITRGQDRLVRPTARPTVLNKRSMRSLAK